MTPPRRGGAAAQYPGMLAMWQRNATLAEIGVRFGVTREWVRRLLVRDGVCVAMARHRRAIDRQLSTLGEPARAAAIALRACGVTVERWSFHARTQNATLRVAGVPVPIVVSRLSRAYQTQPHGPWYFRFSRQRSVRARIGMLPTGPVIVMGSLTHDVYIRDTLRSPYFGPCKRPSGIARCIPLDGLNGVACVRLLRESAGLPAEREAQ